MYANDELFAERNLIKPEPAAFSTESFGHKGKIYDGWETRRRREAGFDHHLTKPADLTALAAMIRNARH